MRRRVVFVFLLILRGEYVSAKSRRQKFDRMWKTKKRECERTTCAALIPDESANCVNKCTSEECFEEVYAENPLEDGEIDQERARQFTNCMRKELRNRRRHDPRRSMQGDKTTINDEGPREEENEEEPLEEADEDQASNVESDMIDALAEVVE